MFKLADYDEKAQAKTLRASIDQLEAALTSMKVQRLVVRDGRDSEQVREYTGDPDTMARLRAVSTAFDLLGVQPSKTTSGSGHHGPVQINVVISPDLARRHVIEVKPADS